MAAPDGFRSDAKRRDDIYRGLLRHALVRLTFLYFIPLLLLTLFIHLQYRLANLVAQKRARLLLARSDSLFLED